MTLSEPWRGLLLGPEPDDRACSLELSADGTFKVSGYTAEETAAMLAAYRNHMTLMLDMTRSGMSPDAVRYRPEEH